MTKKVLVGECPICRRDGVPLHLWDDVFICTKCLRPDIEKVLEQQIKELPF